MTNKTEMPDEIYARPLRPGKCLSAVRPESPLIEERKNADVMSYTKYIRADLVPQWQDISTAPKDGTMITVYAKWSWEQFDENAPYCWRVCYWKDELCYRYDDDDICKPIGGFASRTSNPYTDYACHPKFWLPLQQPPEESE